MIRRNGFKVRPHAPRMIDADDLAPDAPMPFTRAELLAEMRSCLVKRGDRYYATEEGCRRLETWFAEKGISIKVRVSEDGCFGLEELPQELNG